MKILAKKNKYDLRRLVIMVIIFITLFFALPFAAVPGRTTHADEKIYTDVIEDLSKDPNFDVNDYPGVFGGTDMRVIQIAESTDKKLFVYVYLESFIHRSGGDLVPKEIRLSTNINNDDNARWYDYTLKSVSQSSTLIKFKVEGFTVSDDTERFYNITCLFRDYISAIDQKPEGSDDITRQDVAVGQKWKAKTVGNSITYSMVEDSVIEVTNKYVGMFEFAQSGQNYSFLFYCAFNTDIAMDKILEADIGYSMNYVSGHDENHISVTEIMPYSIKTLRSENSFLGVDINEAAALSLSMAKIKSVQSISEFNSNWKDKLTDDVKNRLINKKWVFVFDLRHINGDLWFHKLPPLFYFRVGDFTILRLMFEKDGKVYNLGVVDDKRMSDPTPSNIPELTPWDKFMLWVKKIMSKLFGWDVNSIPNWGAVVFLLVVLCVLGLIVKILWPFFPLIGHGIAALFKGLFWIISAPVRLIASLFKRKGDDK